jgi:hypothetical protein
VDMDAISRSDISMMELFMTHAKCTQRQRGGKMVSKSVPSVLIVGFAFQGVGWLAGWSYVREGKKKREREIGIEGV